MVGGVAVRINMFASRAVWLSVINKTRQKARLTIISHVRFLFMIGL